MKAPPRSTSSTSSPPPPKKQQQLIYGIAVLVVCLVLLVGTRRPQSGGLGGYLSEIQETESVERSSATVVSAPWLKSLATPTATIKDDDVVSPYCDKNSKEAHCCSEEHCQYVKQSTLYSECCNNTLVGIGGKPLQEGQLPQKFPLFITSTPRSGTMFMAHLLVKLGLNVTHDWKTITPQQKGMVSWIHVFADTKYFGPARIANSRFLAGWHQVRDPLKSLTSMTFTELQAMEGNAKTSVKQFERDKYYPFLERHVKFTPKEFLTKNGSEEAYQEYLIYRGLEFWLQWHQFIAALKLPRFQFEELAERHNMTILDDIFKSAGQEPPNHDLAMKFIAKDNRRRRLRLLEEDTQSEEPQQHRRRLKHTNSREHRSTLRWEEMCRVSVELTKQFLHWSHEFGYYHDKKEVC